VLFLLTRSDSELVLIVRIVLIVHRIITIIQVKYSGFLMHDITVG